MPKEKDVKKKKGSQISLHHRIKLLDKDGKIKYDSGEKKSDSFVKNFMAALMFILSDATILSNIYVDHTGATVSPLSKSSWTSANIPWSVAALVTQDNYGIRVGTGNTPVTVNDIDLDALIEHGTAAGELSYGAQTWIDYAEVGGNVDLVWSRVFTNSSGGSITVAELDMSIFTASNYITIARDVLLATVAVGNGEAIVVEYTWRTAA